MLGEWLDSDTKHECLVMLDVLPFANEGQALARIAKRQGRSHMLVSDEFCHRSAEIADAFLYSPFDTGLFLESTLGFNAPLALIVDHAANASTGEASNRLVSRNKNARSLKLF